MAVVVLRSYSRATNGPEAGASDGRVARFDPVNLLCGINGYHRARSRERGISTLR